MTTSSLAANFTSLENFGHSLRLPSYVLQPTRLEGIADAFLKARRLGLTVTARGAGRSYNDAALNGGGIVLDLSRMNRILKWDSSTGEVVAEPGVTLQQLWQHIVSDGWWPPVVSGTMLTTLGGCLAANIHGKNNFKMGTIGEHVLEFTAILPTGARVTCSPKKNSELFHAMMVVTTLEELDEQALIDILVRPRNALVKQYRRLLEMDGVNLKFTDGALRAIARAAIMNRAGARGLRAIVEAAMLDVMYEVPSRRNVREIVISEDVIEKGEAPLVVLDKAADSA